MSEQAVVGVVPLHPSPLPISTTRNYTFHIGTRSMEKIMNYVRYMRDVVERGPDNVCGTMEFALAMESPILRLWLFYMSRSWRAFWLTISIGTTCHGSSSNGSIPHLFPRLHLYNCNFVTDITTLARIPTEIWEPFQFYHFPNFDFIGWNLVFQINLIIIPKLKIKEKFYFIEKFVIDWVRK